LDILFDIEGDGLNPTRIYVLSYYDGKDIISLTDYNDMIDVLTSARTLIGHNIIRFDIPVLERILEISLKGKKIIDTLGLSWYLYPNRKSHGLASYGDKVEILDWINLDPSIYIERCEQDVRTNLAAYKQMKSYLNFIYDNNTDEIIDYLNFKLDCLREQEELKIKLDVEKLEENLIFFLKEKEKKYEILKHSMPLDSKGKPANPNSILQLKNWLYSLGWVPDLYKKNPKGKNVEQIYDEDKNLTKSVKRLIIDNPELEHLESLTVISNRLGILKRLLELGDYAEASAYRLTNTLRLRHMNIVKPS